MRRTERGRVMMKAAMGVLVVAVVLGGCHSSAEPETPENVFCRLLPADDMRMARRTAADSVEGGVDTRVGGVRQAGSTAIGWVSGGSRRAERDWNEGNEEGRELEGDVQLETSLPPCPE